MIAIDLDGTLLTSRSEITENSVAALHEAISEGIELVIATGRGQFDVRNLLKETGLSPWIIGGNGATIHHPDGTPFRTFPLKKSRAIDIIRWLQDHDYYYEVFSEHAIYTPENGRKLIEMELERLQITKPEHVLNELKRSAVEQFKQFGFEFVTGYKEIVLKNQPIYNILVFSLEEDKLKAGRHFFSKQEDIHVGDSGYHNFEIGSMHTSKGNALLLLAEHMNIPLCKIAAIGDSMNDLSMLEVAGLSIAMGNANKEIIDVCTMMTDSHDAEGVANVINRLKSSGFGS